MLAAQLAQNPGSVFNRFSLSLFTSRFLIYKSTETESQENDKLA